MIAASAFGRWKRKDQNFKVIIGYVVSSRLTWDV